MESRFTPGVRPLYRQVYDYLIEQVAAGTWKPGAVLPSEQALGHQLGVSQGTVRKALDELTSNGVMERHQGKGTFVAANSEERSLFRFFHLCTPGGVRVTPSATGEKVTRRTATSADVAHLGLGKNARVIEIKRVRLIDQRPVVFETIIVSATMLAGLDKRKTLPNSLYSLYHSVFGINIGSVKEELRADLAGREDRDRLGVAVGSPLLHIDRVAFGIDGARVEWRISRCSTSHHVYAVELS
ncbi:MAG: GntR family transcriptional regulator [Rudaea sp.]